MYPRSVVVAVNKLRRQVCRTAIGESSVRHSGGVRARAAGAGARLGPRVVRWRRTTAAFYLSPSLPLLPHSPFPSSPRGSSIFRETEGEGSAREAALLRYTHTRRSSCPVPTRSWPRSHRRCCIDVSPLPHEAAKKTTRPTTCRMD